MAKIEVIEQKFVVKCSIDIHDIITFETENFYGFWDDLRGGYVTIFKECDEWVSDFISFDYEGTLEELYTKVLEVLEEPIIEVYNEIEYKIELIK